MAEGLEGFTLHLSCIVVTETPVSVAGERSGLCREWFKCIACVCSCSEV